MLLKLLSEGYLSLGDSELEKIPDLIYPILNIIRHEKERNVHFSIEKSDIKIKFGNQELIKPASEFIDISRDCLKAIKSRKGAFQIPEVERFLKSISITSLKEKSNLKNDITIQIHDPKTYISPVLGFSIKSQIGSPSTLLNASSATNFIYIVKGNLSNAEMNKINSMANISDRIQALSNLKMYLKFEKVKNSIFKLNLQTIDYYLDHIVAEMLIIYYSKNKSTIRELIESITEMNPLKYDLSINSRMYELMVRKFLLDYALGMRASTVWERDYEATGGYLIVKEDGEIVCYHFYFQKHFENYLYKNTRLETGSQGRHGFGQIYEENGLCKMKLNLQIRFIR